MFGNGSVEKQPLGRSLVRLGVSCAVLGNNKHYIMDPLTAIKHPDGQREMLEGAMMGLEGGFTERRTGWRVSRRAICQKGLTQSTMMVR